MNSDQTPQLSGEYVKKYYDGFLSKLPDDYAHYRWGAGPVERLHYFQTKRSLAPYLAKLAGTVLEVGGGDAIWTYEYIEHVERLTFLDISEEMIARAKKRLASSGEKITYVNTDFLQNTFPDGGYDGFVSIRNLEYFTDKEKFISEVSRLLKPQGHFVLVTKSPKYNWHDTAKNKTLHTAQITIQDLITMIQNHGFVIRDVQPAIFGKLFRFAITRFISNTIQMICSWIPWKLLPLWFLAHFSESFMIYAQKK